MEGNARICDFGLNSISENIDTVNASTPNCGCTVRYCAPELLDTEEVVSSKKKKPTYKSDVYSLSMVIVEVRLSLEVLSPGLRLFSSPASDRKDAIP